MAKSIRSCRVFDKSPESLSSLLSLLFCHQKWNLSNAEHRASRLSFHSPLPMVHNEMVQDFASVGYLLRIPFA